MDPTDPNRPENDIYTTDVYVPEGLRDSIELDRVGVPLSLAPTQQIQTQYDANQALLKEVVLSAKNTARTVDLFDFSQNTVVQGYWTHVIDEGGAPDVSEFYAYDQSGANTIQFLDIKTIKFNDTGVPGSPNDDNILAAARIGDYLVIQSTQDNHFGAYVITGLNLYNTNGVIIRELIVKVFEGTRAFGDVEYGDNCSVRVLRPRSVVCQEEEPDVAHRGILWYRESDDILSISNYPTGMLGAEGPQWTEINGGGGDTSDLENRVSAGEAKQIELDGRVSQGEQRQELILLNIGAIQTSYLPLAGGSMTGDIAMNGKKVTGMGDPTADAQAANKRYVDTRLKRTGGTGQKMEGIFYMGGYKIAGVGDPELSTDAANRRFVEEQIAAIPDPVGGGGPTKKYDGNRFCKSGVSGATLDNGDVMFFNDQLASTTDPAKVAALRFLLMNLIGISVPILVSLKCKAVLQLLVVTLSMIIN